MKRHNFLIIIAVFILLAGVFGHWFFIKREKEPEMLTERIGREDLEQIVSVTGTVRKEKDANLSFALPGIVKEIKVSEGEEVKKGQILATLDAQDLKMQIAQAQAMLKQAQAALKIAQDENLKVYQTAYDNAVKNLEDIKMKNAKKITASKTEVKNAYDYWQDTKKYYEQVQIEHNESSTTTPQSTVETAKRTLTSAYNAYKSAQETLTSVKKTAEADENFAQRERESALKTLQEKIAASTLPDKSTLINQVSYQRAGLELAQANYNKAVMKAPFSGKIGKITQDEGEYLPVSSPLLNLQSGETIVEADIPEADITKIKIGQEAKITLDAFGDDKIFKGQIIAVNEAATKIQDVIYYKAKVSFDNPENLPVKSGMTADISILTASKKNVLAIPVRAVKEKNGQKYVQIKENREIKDVNVVSGLLGEGGKIEIVSGLIEGQEVITFVKK